ncbi:MAG: ribonuclease HII [Clostridia bacterium]|nr:ribonuclease HII [Clostridia bacterium]
MTDNAFDLAYFNRYSVFCGIDEAGRGCLCGPVCAAAVILPKNAELKGVDDSKKLSPKKREELYGLITSQAVSWCAAFASPEEIDRLNILKATFLAMKRAVEGLETRPEFALVDGNRCEGLGIPFECIVKGDSKSLSVASASIIAKVTRDRFMDGLAKRYPMYALDEHKGYPTEKHYAKIREYGICDIYRKTFLKKMH